MDELIAEIENSQKGSRVLDEQIRLVVIAEQLASGKDGAEVRREMGGWSLDDPDSNVPHYSTSLDAVLQLVPASAANLTLFSHIGSSEGDEPDRWGARFHDRSQTMGLRAAKEQIKRLKLPSLKGAPCEVLEKAISEHWLEFYCYDIATPALALCAACLRARQQATSAADTG